MARKAMIEKNEKNRALAEKYFAHRADLRRKAVDPKLSDEERELARLALQKLPRDTSMSRVVSRCKMTGRPRGNLRKFGLCRNMFRKMALEGRLPGVTKASW